MQDHQSADRLPLPLHRDSGRVKVESLMNRGNTQCIRVEFCLSCEVTNALNLQTGDTQQGLTQHLLWRVKELGGGGRRPTHVSPAVKSQNGILRVLKNKPVVFIKQGNPTYQFFVIQQLFDAVSKAFHNF